MLGPRELEKDWKMEKGGKVETARAGCVEGPGERPTHVPHRDREVWVCGCETWG